MVAVGDHERRAGDRGGDAARWSSSSSARSRWRTPSPSMQVASRAPRRLRGVRTALAPATGTRSGRGWLASPAAVPAGRSSPSASCARGGARRPGQLERGRRPHRGCAASAPPRPRSPSRRGRSAARSSTIEHALGLRHVREPIGRGRVRIVAAEGGSAAPSCAGRRPREWPVRPRRSRHKVEPPPHRRSTSGGVVADPGEGKEVGHGRVSTS